MCGRVRFSSEFSEIKIRLRIDFEAPVPNIPASWNVCPTDPMLVVPAVVGEDGKRVCVQMKWGLVPWWSKDSKTAFKTINARSETVDTTPAFRDAWKRGQRCLVVTNGFYEWNRATKQPYAIGMADDGPMVMAGIWDEWRDQKTSEVVRSCAVLTCPPNGVVGAIHDRMPVILAEEDFPKWLGEEPTTLDQLKALLIPCPDDWLRIWPVNRTKIGNVRNKSREVAEPELL